MDETKIKCSDCYVDSWKNLRKDFTTCEFDYSIKKEKSFRRLYDDYTMIHYCFSCLKETLFSKQYLVIDFMEWIRDKSNNKLLVPKDGYVANVLQNKNTIEKVCNNCLTFLVDRIDDLQINNAYFFILDEKVCKMKTVCILLIITISLLYNYNECLFGFCFGVAYISGVYFVHWIVTYFI